MRCLDFLSSVTGCFTLPLFELGQLIQQWVASSSLWAGAGWWAARVIEKENSVPYRKTQRHIQTTDPFKQLNQKG